MKPMATKKMHCTTMGHFKMFLRGCLIGAAQSAVVVGVAFIIAYALIGG